jgi:glycosyltransferase involved in cell wall biosynthesis
MEKYKILHIEYRDYIHPEAGGAEVVLREVYRRLTDQGHQVDYLTSQYPGCVPTDVMDGVRMIRTGNKWNFNWVAPRYFKKHLEQNNYDVIIEGIDKIPFFFPLYTKSPVLPLVPHLFGTTVFREAAFPAATYVWLMEQFIPMVYKKCPYYMTYSKSTAEDLANRGVNADKVHVVYIAMDHELYRAPEPGTVKEPHSIAFVGRLKRYKFIDYGIQAVARMKSEFPDMTYHIVGRGDNQPALEALTKQLGVENNVKFWGFVDEAKKVEILQKSQVLLYNSEKEGWGLTAIEANACQTPVIASNSPGLREAVSDGKSGFLIEHGNMDQLTGKIREIFVDKALQQKLQQGAVEWAATFNWDKTAEGFLEFIDRTAKDWGK